MTPRVSIVVYRSYHSFSVKQKLAKTSVNIIHPPTRTVLCLAEDGGAFKHQEWAFVCHFLGRISVCSILN